MKQKIVIKVAMNCDKCRSKALQIAAVAHGVSSVSLEGADRDQLVVTGDGVDSVSLAKLLRKKFSHATIASVQEVKQEEDKKKEESKPTKLPMYYYSQCPPYPSYVVCDQYSSDSRIIM